MFKLPIKLIFICTNNFNIPELSIKDLFRSIHTRIFLIFQIYRIIPKKYFIQAYKATKDVCIHLISLHHQKYHLLTHAILHQSTLIKLSIKTIPVFGEDNNQPNIILLMWCATELLNWLFPKGYILNLPQKPRFKKVLDFFLTVTILQKLNLISKDIFDVIYEHNIQRNLSMIKKEEEIFGFLFLGENSKISLTTLLNISVNGINLPVSVI